MKRLLIALVALVALASGIWFVSGPRGDALEGPRAEPSVDPNEPDEPEEDPHPSVAASEILDLRARAVMQDDREAFLAPIDPKAKGFRKQQRKVFDRLASLRFGRYVLEVQTGDGDFARREHERRYRSAAEVFIPRVEEAYRFKGYDDADFVSNIFFTFVLRDGEWLIAADDDTKGRKTTDRNLWDYGPVEQTRGRNVTLVQHPCRGDCVEIGDSFMQLAEAARKRVKQRWDGPWNGRVVVLVTSSRREVRNIIDVDYAISNFAAFAYSPFLETGYSPARIVVDRATLAASPPDFTELLLAHEIAHVASRRLSGPHIPLWVEEGLAEWIARTPGDPEDLYYANQVAVGAVEPRLATDRQFRRGSAEELFLHYQSSRTAVTYFIERWGYKKFIRFYRILGDSHTETGGREAHLRESMRRVIKLNPAQFEKQWADSI